MINNYPVLEVEREIPLNIDCDIEIGRGEKGEDGREIELSKNETHIQYRYVGDDVWVDLIPLSAIKGDKGDKGDKFVYEDFTPEQLLSLKGDKGDKGDVGLQGIQGEQGIQGNDGRKIEIRKTDTYIQYKYEGDTLWVDLVLLEDLKGEKGEQGIQGIQGIQGEKGEQGIQGLRGEQGLKGDKGDTPSIIHLETQVSNKLAEVDTTINNIETAELERESKEQIRESQEIAREESIKNMKSAVDSKIVEVNNAKNNMENTISASLESFENRFNELEAANPIGEVTNARTSLDGTIKANLSERLKYDFDKKSNVGDSYLKSESYSKEEVDTVIANVEVDLTGYATETFVTTKDSENLQIAKDYTDSKVSQMNNLILEVVSELPQLGEAKKVYLVKNMDTQDNLYTEYVWLDNKWEIWGSASIDLSSYATKEEVATQLDSKSDKTHNHNALYASKSSEHNHSNKTVIDSITDVKVEEWNNKEVKGHKHSEYLTELPTHNHSYNDLTEKPTIPSKTSELTNDSGFITSADVDTSQNHMHSNKTVLDGITANKVTAWDNKSNFDGDYNSLTNKPNIPSIEGLTTKTYVDEELAKKSDVHEHPYKPNSYVPSWNEVTEKPTEFNPTSHNHNSSYYLKTETKSSTEIETIVSDINTSIDTKVDKVEGKGLSTNDFTTDEKTKLSKLENYTHPVNHNASMIVEDTTHRFVTDAEKSGWNSKAEGDHNHNEQYASKTNEHTHSNKVIIDKITESKMLEWDNKSNFSGNYNDLTEKPNIPSINGLASETYVNEKVAEIVNSAPETLDTLKELSDALGNDPNFATTVTTQIGTKADKTSVYTKVETDALVKAKTEVNDTVTSNTSVWSSSKVNTELGKKSDVHTHPYKPNSYVPTWNEIEGRPSSYPPSTHNHNDVYYSKIEVDNKLSSITPSVTASNVLMENGNSVEMEVNSNKTSILSLTKSVNNLNNEVNGARLDLINTNNSIRNKLV